jgi:hypothetical protein
MLINLLAHVNPKDGTGTQDESEQIITELTGPAGEGDLTAFVLMEGASLKPVVPKTPRAKKQKADQEQHDAVVSAVLAQTEVTKNPLHLVSALPVQEGLPVDPPVSVVDGSAVSVASQWNPIKKGIIPEEMREADESSASSSPEVDSQESAGEEPRKKRKYTRRALPVITATELPPEGFYVTPVTPQEIVSPSITVPVTPPEVVPELPKEEPVKTVVTNALSSLVPQPTKSDTERVLAAVENLWNEALTTEKKADPPVECVATLGNQTSATAPVAVTSGPGFLVARPDYSGKLKELMENYVDGRPSDVLQRLSMLIRFNEAFDEAAEATGMIHNKDSVFLREFGRRLGV